MSPLISDIPTEESYRAAAELIMSADTLLITAGAGLGVDSGLPDFRGAHGFYNAYPQFKALDLSWYNVSNPNLFIKQPRLAWGFYAHRYHMYKNANPHVGYDILKHWLEHKDGFVFTSNVDGHFIMAGFAKNKIVECHGSINHIQCLRNCNGHVRFLADLSIAHNDDTMLANGRLPTCPFCGGLARPNILMFNDVAWSSLRHDRQANFYRVWLDDSKHKKIVVIEIGAGIAIPRVREQFRRSNMSLIRINPNDCIVPYGSIALKERAVIALQNIDKYIR